ncbi:hypothetical protein N7462_010781 [Penicillium macrosclerotiorum]|uniref:uncharacterized protein n=1 Tax=Penicillium macrosclerotiorum TaxID=303699 RepID=UPI002546850A|nr:uncharacterized protein N7462_010781 [Penicillium macrosclerotiorum]KAJ5669711.1 hypothetical protein N7462_010781 [Penicillium macrosclerotiorum]
MSFGRHAYRHVLRPPSPPTIDHLWISDDLLASTFRRFANGQRRHGSCVPGPLEARRRLARRRNTALAGFGVASAEDIACLFGRNGREHMKWTDHPWQRAHFENQDVESYTLGMADTQIPFYHQNPEPTDSAISSDNPSTPYKTAHKSRPQILAEYLDTENWSIEDVRDFARRLRIDLQREPTYSRQIFEKLIKRSTTDLRQAIKFLDDPFLNTRGSGNYIAAVKMFIRTKAKRSNRVHVLNSVVKALELGLVPSDELCLIVRAIPNILVERNKTLGNWDQKALLKHYRAMWKAIGRCNILGFRDLDKGVVSSWITQLLNVRSFRFAEEIIVATHDANSDVHWPTTLIMAQLKTLNEIDASTALPYPYQMLSQLNEDCAARSIVDVTETLALSMPKGHARDQLLERWRECLLRVSNISAIASSQVWLDLPLAYTDSVKVVRSPLITPVQRHIILRLWILRSLSRALGPMYNQNSRPTDQPIYMLLSLFETATQYTDGSFLSDLMGAIQSLNLPHNSLLLLAVDLKIRKLTTRATRRTLERLETSATTLTDVWADPVAYKGIQSFFYGTFEQMFRRLDLTSPESVAECLHLARSGDSKSVWSVLRLLRNHTPFKLCLNKAWVPLPHPGEKALVRYHPGPRDAQSPDPYVAVEFIHQLAVAFSCCQQLTPSRSFHLIHWLYDYLRRHGGPVYPSLVQAMYHAGVVRYRREGRRISPTQYEYILWIVSKFEGPDVANQLRSPAQIGQGTSR